MGSKGEAPQTAETIGDLAKQLVDAGAQYELASARWARERLGELQVQTDYKRKAMLDHLDRYLGEVNAAISAALEKRRLQKVSATPSQEMTKKPKKK